MSFTKSNGLLTAALMLSVGATVNAFAQQAPESEGIVRISDGRGRSNAGPAANRIVQVNSQQVAPGAGPQPVAAGCPSGDCQGNYGYGYGGGGCPYCHGHGCGRCGGCGLFREHWCHHSPDYGYSPPAKYPLHRRGVEYTNYYPQYWYGTGPGLPSQAPMVYAPTDTTQLGFYYQHVPFWQPQPNRLPERPIPAQWHILAPTVSASGFCRGGRCQGGYCQGDYGTIYGTPVNSGPAVPSPTGSSEVVPQIQTAPGQPTPAAQQAPQALPGSPTLPDTGTAPNPLPQLQSGLPQLQSAPQTLIQTSNTAPAAKAAPATNVPAMTLSKP